MKIILPSSDAWDLVMERRLFRKTITTLISAVANRRAIAASRDLTEHNRRLAASII